MVDGSLGMVVEGLVSVLLAASIYYSILVNRKLERLRSEQKGMQSFIRELSLATTNADKAIQSLRKTVEASGDELAVHIEKGRNMSRQLKGEIEQAEETMNRLVVLAGSASRKAGIIDDPTMPAAEACSAPAPVAAPQQAAATVPPGASVAELRRRMMGFEDLENDDDASRIADELVAGAAAPQSRGG